MTYSKLVLGESSPEEEDPTSVSDTAEVLFADVESSVFAQ